MLIDCPPSLGLLTVNGLFAADRALVVTEPGAWASDGVAQILRTVERISARRGPDGLGVAGIVVNRLGPHPRRPVLVRPAGRDLRATRSCPPIHLRAAVPESAAQSLPIHGLGSRAGAGEAAAEFDALLAAVVSRRSTRRPTGDARRRTARRTGREPEPVDLRPGAHPRWSRAGQRARPRERSQRWRSTTPNGRAAGTGVVRTRARLRSTPSSAGRDRPTRPIRPI